MIGFVLTASFFYLGIARVGVGSQLVSSPEDKSTNDVGKETLDILLALKSLELDESIFKEFSFKSLQDFSIELGEKELGRDNPFENFIIGSEIVVKVEVPKSEGGQEGGEVE